MAKLKAAAPSPPSSNWNALKKSLHPAAALSTSSNATSLKRRRSSLSSSVPAAALIKGKGAEKRNRFNLDAERDDEEDFERGDASGSSAVGSGSSSRKTEIPVASILAGGGTAGYQAGPGQFLAMDCEMVGVGPEGSESTLARVSIVNYHGATVLDRFVRPRERVTDYRTWVSGVREEDLRNAPVFADVQKEVADLIKGRVLVGHALTNDTQVLLLSHPRPMTRDTAHYAPLQGLAKTKKPGLKTLAKLVLGVDIQSGEHSSVDDARATMAIYRSQKPAWESSLRTRVKPTLQTNTTSCLASLDLTLVSTKGVRPSANPRPKTLGLAATLRNARAEKELEEAREKEMGEEEAEERSAKKRKREEADGLLLGFDFEVRKIVEPVPKVAKVKQKDADAEEKKKKKRGPKKGIRGDEEKRPKSSDGWWVE